MPPLWQVVTVIVMWVFLNGIVQVHVYTTSVIGDPHLFDHLHWHRTGNGLKPSLQLSPLVRTHKRAVTRQVHEATMIDCSQANIIMNSKAEYNGSRIPRIRMEVGDRVLTRDYQGTGTQTHMDQLEDERSANEEHRVLEWEKSRNDRRRKGPGDEGWTLDSWSKWVAGGEGTHRSRCKVGQQQQRQDHSQDKDMFGRRTRSRSRPWTVARTRTKSSQETQDQSWVGRERVPPNPLGQGESQGEREGPWTQQPSNTWHTGSGRTGGQRTGSNWARN